MVELAIRLLASGGLVLLAGLLGWSWFDAVWITASFVCLYALGAYALSLKGKWNAGTAGVAACLDAAAISALLSASGSTSSFGFLVLAPIAYAAAKYGSLPSAMAPISAFVLLGADQWSRQGSPSESATMAQALGVLAIGLLLNHRRIVVTVAKPVLPERVEPLHSQEPDGYMELRESFRRLKDMYQELDRKSRRDRHSADLRLCASGDAIRFHRRLATQLQRLSGAEGLSLYTVSEAAGTMVVRALEGAVPDAARQSTLSITPGEALAGIRNQTEKAIAALVRDDAERAARNVVLTHKGKVAGLVALYGVSRQELNEAAEAVEELGPLVAEMIEENASKRAFEGRLRRAELLYEVVSASSGAATPNSLAARIVSQLSEQWDVEHISICWLDGEDVLPAASHGSQVRPLDAMSFVSGAGVPGWIGVGAPEIVAFDVSDDVRCRQQDMKKQRIQSFAIAPIGSIGETMGYLLAASPRSGAVGVPVAEAVRMVAAEAYQALLRLRHAPEPISGLALPNEFHRRVLDSSDGSLVYLEPLRREEAVARYGAPAIELALRQLAIRLRSRLPEGAAICRRQEGDYVAYLPGAEESSARQWANEAAATASLIGIPVGEDGRRVPLAVRAKVARMGAVNPQQTTERAFETA